MKFKVLSIDAWREMEGWSWNNWYNVDTYSEIENGELTEKNALYFFFLSLGFKGTYKEFIKLYDIYDDQYNLVLIDKKDDRPIYAIEYGSKY